MLAVPLLSGCLKYNAECSAPSDLVDPDLTIGVLEEAISVEERAVRTEEMAIGNMITDAYMDAYTNPANPSFVAPAGQVVAAAFTNAGGIREEGFCAPVESLLAGPIRRVDLREVLPFTNRVVVVELTGVELNEVLEHGVSALTDPDDPDRGFFLQVSSELSFAVDCTFTAQVTQNDVITVVGRRVSNVEIGGNPIVATDRYRIATNDFLVRAEGNDGFVTLAGRPIESTLARLDVAVVEDYLTLQSLDTGSPYSVAVGGRITQSNCD